MQYHYNYLKRGVRYGIIDFHLQKNNSNFGLLSGTKYRWFFFYVAISNSCFINFQVSFCKNIFFFPKLNSIFNAHFLAMGEYLSNEFVIEDMDSRNTELKQAQIWSNSHFTNLEKFEFEHKSSSRKINFSSFKSLSLETSLQSLVSNTSNISSFLEFDFLKIKSIELKLHKVWNLSSKTRRGLSRSFEHTAQH